MHPDPKAPEEETVEEGTVEEGAVGGGMEEQVIGEVWDSQEGEEEVAAEGEGEEEECDGEGEFLSKETEPSNHLKCIGLQPFVTFYRCWDELQ